LAQNVIKNYYTRIRSIRNKFLFVIIPLLLVTLAGATFVLDIHIKDSESRRLTNKLDALSDTYGKMLASSLWILDYERIALILNAISADPEVVYVSVYDKTKSLISDSGSKGIRNDPKYSTSVDIFYETSITGKSIIVGRLELSLTDSLVVSAQQERLGLSVTLAILLIVSIIASALMANTWSVGIPLRRVMKAIRHYDDSGERISVDWETNDEIGTVIEAFNSMQMRQNVYENELRAARDDLEQRVLDRTTALVKARDEAELAKLSMSKFLANISHELRTPLNAILGLSEFMMGEHLGPVENLKYREYIGDIHNSGHYLLELIDDVLDLSKAEFGKMQLNETTFNLRIAVEGALKIAEGWTSNSDLEISKDIPNQPLVIKADERAIKQILLNLLSNSIKFTPDNGKITIKIEHDSISGCKIIVSDTGQGISHDNIAKVMEPFIQLDDPYTRTHKGTGLGLALVKSLAELHGGSLSINSELGVGTTVEALLPSTRII
jgi:signal transduction histidine kinase